MIVRVTLCRRVLMIFCVVLLKVIVHVGAGIAITVLRHLVPPTHPYKVDFLGFYVQQRTGLSNFTHGLVGEFIQHVLTSPLLC